MRFKANWVCRTAGFQKSDFKITVNALVKEVNCCFRQISEDQNRGSCWSPAVNVNVLLKNNSGVKH